MTQMARGPVACSRESLGMEPAVMTRVHSPGRLPNGRTSWDVAATAEVLDGGGLLEGKRVRAHACL